MAGKNAENRTTKGREGKPFKVMDLQSDRVIRGLLEEARGPVIETLDELRQRPVETSYHRRTPSGASQ